MVRAAGTVDSLLVRRVIAGTDKQRDSLCHDTLQQADSPPELAGDRMKVPVLDERFPKRVADCDDVPPFEGGCMPAAPPSV